jgi:hypothetical protein
MLYSVDWPVDWWIMNWKEWASMRSWANIRLLPEYAWRNWENYENSCCGSSSANRNCNIHTQNGKRSVPLLLCMAEHEGQNWILSLQLSFCGAMKFYLDTSSRSIRIYPHKNVFSSFGPHWAKIPYGWVRPPWIKQEIHGPRTVTHAQACQLMTVWQRTSKWADLSWGQHASCKPPFSLYWDLLRYDVVSLVGGTHGRRRGLVGPPPPPLDFRNYMALGPSWGAVNCAAIQELPNILWNLKVHYSVHNTLPLVPILSQINPVHTTPSYISKIHFNVIPPPTSCCS